MQAASTTESPLLTQEEWAALFPIDDYRKIVKSKKGEAECDLSLDKIRAIRGNSLKFLIASRQPTKNILEWIQHLKEIKSLQLDSAYTRYEFTALMIAIMRNNIPVVEALIEAGASLKKRDKYGFKPIHHAALVSKEMMRVLLNSGAKIKSRTRVGATCRDLWEMTGQRPSVGSFDHVFCRAQDYTVSQVSIEEFNRLHGFKMYTDTPYYPPEKIKVLWMESPQDILPVNEALEREMGQIYRAMVKNPSRLIVEMDSDLAWISEMGAQEKKDYGLFAGEYLEFTRGIIEYSGKVIEEKLSTFAASLEESSDKYLVESLDARLVCNVAHFVIDGFPNAGLFTAANEAGRPRRVFLAVIDPQGIKRNEEIYVDFGASTAKLKWSSCHVTGNGEEMHHYYKTNSIESLISSHSEANQRLRDCVKRGQKFDLKDWFLRSFIEARLRFLFTTPGALIDLTCNKIIRPQQLSPFLKPSHSPLVIELYRKNAGHMEWIEKLITLMEEFEVCLAKLSALEGIGPKLDLQMREVVLGLQGKITTLQIIESIMEINKTIQVALDSADPLQEAPLQLNALSDKLETLQPAYDCYPLGMPMKKGPAVFNSELLLKIFLGTKE